MIKKLIGRLTKPDGIVEYFGRFYAPCFGMPDVYGKMRLEHDFCYVEYEQNWIGAWEKRDSWLGLNSPIVNTQEG